MFNDTRLCHYLELLTYFGAPANETQDNLYHVHTEYHKMIQKEVTSKQQRQNKP